MTSTEPHPFRTEPYVRVKVWGGRRLPDPYGKEAPAGEPIGETWEVADLEEGESRAATGPARGEPLSELVDCWGDDLVGAADPSEGFPLLVKIIDAADDLSVQVHPSQEDVDRDFSEADSKDECWLVLDAEPEGSILHGVRDDVDAEAFLEAVEEGRAVELLRRIDVETGHTVRVPPGTIHAICEGVTLLEIQEPSDTTYRVYDYDRPGLDGEPRELHLERAMAVAHFDEQPPAELTGAPSECSDADVAVLADTPSYRIERAVLRDDTEWRGDSSSPQILFVVDDRIDIRGSASGVTATVAEAQTAVVPASSESIVARPHGTSATLIVAGLGGPALLA
jgi:mannose-6-phosphate isomerase